jgi:hypothetical protein
MQASKQSQVGALADLLDRVGWVGSGVEGWGRCQVGRWRRRGLKVGGSGVVEEAGVKDDRWQRCGGVRGDRRAIALWFPKFAKCCKREGV